MFKLLRKYDKWILAIGGSLLMVVFLLPQALEQFGANPQKSVVALVDGGRKITEKDRMDAQREISMLDTLSPQIAGVMLQLGGANAQIARDDLGPALHWLLLTRDAQRDGLIGGAQDGRSFIPIAARFFARQYVLQNRFSLDPSQFPDIEAQLTQTYTGQLEGSRTQLINSGMPPVMVDRTLAKARGVLRMYEAYLAFDLPSLQESMALCHRYFDSADIVYFTVGSDAFVDPSYEPDETEILLHFDAYKENLPGEGRYGFGYRAEDRVRLEWLRISRQDISDGVAVDPVDANTRWRANRTQYPGEFTAERSNVEKDIRSERTDSILRDAEQLVRAELLKARGGLVQNDAGLYDLPADWAQIRPRFNVISQIVGDRLRTKHGPDMPNPMAQDDSNQWRTRAEVRGIPIVGNASRLIGPRSVPLVDLAFSVAEISPDSLYAAQTGVAQGPLTAARTGDLVFFRVIEAEASAPMPLAEVRGQVIEDKRRLKAYEALETEAPRMLSQMLTLGVEGAAAERGVTLLRGVNVRRERVEAIDPTKGPPVYELQKINTESFRNAVMDRVASFPNDEPLNRIPERDLLLSLPLDVTREYAIVGITNVIPLTVEAFRMIESEALRYNRSQEFNLNALDAWPYSPSQMQARHNVQLIQRADPDEADESVEGADETPPVADAEKAAD